MKIFVAGTGRVAKCVIEKLTEQGHIVYCGSRHHESIAETDLCKPVQFDLQAEKDSILYIASFVERDSRIA